jgi:hypothetical protein
MQTGGRRPVPVGECENKRKAGIEPGVRFTLTFSIAVILQYSYLRSSFVRAMYYFKITQFLPRYLRRKIMIT